MHNRSGRNEKACKNGQDDYYKGEARGWIARAPPVAPGPIDWMKRGQNMVKRMVWVVLAVTAGGLGLAGCTEPTGPAEPVDIIIDNTESACKELSGGWQTGSWTDGTGYYGTEFLLLEANQTNVGMVRFYPGFPVAGEYEVFLWWPQGSNWTTAQPVIVHDADGDDTYSVDLTQGGSGWYSLWVHRFAAGNAGYIEVNTNTPAPGRCIADAVRVASTW